MTINELLKRLIYLIHLLETDNTWSSNRLADECGVSQRTIFRDLDRLEDLGVRIELTKKGYRLRDRSDLLNLMS